MPEHATARNNLQLLENQIGDTAGVIVILAITKSERRPSELPLRNPLTRLPDNWGGSGHYQNTKPLSASQTRWQMIQKNKLVLQLRKPYVFLFQHRSLLPPKHPRRPKSEFITKRRRDIY